MTWHFFGAYITVISLKLAYSSYEVSMKPEESVECHQTLSSQVGSWHEAKGLVNCIYKPCPTALYSAVQSCCSSLSHNALHHCLSSNNSLETAKEIFSTIAGAGD